MNSFPHKEGSIHQTNFEHTISDDDFKRKALQSFKDEYLLNFIKIEDPEDVDERVIGQSIIQNTKNFIMAFGKDFAFMGNQHYLEVDDCIPLRVVLRWLCIFIEIPIWRLYVCYLFYLIIRDALHGL